MLKKLNKYRQQIVVLNVNLKRLETMSLSHVENLMESQRINSRNIEVSKEEILDKIDSFKDSFQRLKVSKEE